MTTYNSPLGSKQIKDKNLKTFTVSDVDDEMVDFNENNDSVTSKVSENESADFYRELERIKALEKESQERRASVDGKERLNPGALERISVLLGLTRQTRTVDLGNNVIFVLRSLKSSEYQQVLSLTSKSSGVESPFEMRRQYLARSIHMVAGVPINDFIGSDLLEAKLAFVDQLDDGVADRLYDEYLVLRDNVKNKYKLDDPNIAEEVGKDLKKS